MDENVPGTRGLVQIKEFFIFNPSLGNDHDDEIGKILYYYPSDTDTDSQLKKVGLCEAIIRFSENFNNDVPCESLHTQKLRYVFIQPEPDYWFGIVLTIPSMLRMSPEGIEMTDYHNDQVQDSVFQAVLWKLYRKFALINDKLDTISKMHGIPALKAALSKSIDVNLQKVDAHQCGISEIFSGLKFLPLDRYTFLKVQCFINSLLMTWNPIKYLILLQGDRLIWSGVGQTEIQVLYDYLIKDLLSQHLLAGADRQSTFGFILKKKSHISISICDDEISDKISSEDSYVTATSASAIDAPRRNSKVIHLHEQRPRRRYHMLIYKAEQTYLSMYLRDTEDLNTEFMIELEAFLSLNFSPLARILTRDANATGLGSMNASPGSSVKFSNHLLSSDPTPPNIKFIYFNNLNLAEKKSPGYECDTNSYRMIADLKADLSRISENGEITVKMVSDPWIVAKTSNMREFYAIFNNRGSNILEIDEELKKLTDSHLGNIFFQD